MSESSDEKSGVWVEDDQLPEDLQPQAGDTEGETEDDIEKPDDPLPEG